MPSSKDMALVKLRKIITAIERYGPPTELDKFRQELDSFLLKTHTKRWKPQDPGHRPSSVGSKCLRQAYYDYFRLEPQKSIDLNGAITFEFGNYLEMMVRDWLFSMGRGVAYLDPKSGEVPLDLDGEHNPEFPIYHEEFRVRKGYIDVVSIEKGKLWIYELKSKKEEYFLKLTEPDEDHQIQAGIYADAFKKMHAKGEFDHIPGMKNLPLGGVRYLYISKGKPGKKIFEYQGEDLDKLIKKVSTKVKKLNKYADSKELPPKTEGMCFFCAHWKRCKNEENVV